jgi:hypothetical protein
MSSNEAVLPLSGRLEGSSYLSAKLVCERSTDHVVTLLSTLRLSTIERTEKEYW